MSSSTSGKRVIAGGLGAVLACALLWHGPALAQMPVFVETYEGVPAPCEGLSRNGVGYTFTLGGVPAGDCMVATFAGPAAQMNSINPPHMEGNAAGVLHLTFDVPTTVFGFGVAQSATVPTSQFAVVHLNRPGDGLLREEVLLLLTPDPNFVGARYDYSGPAVKTVSIHFSTPGGRFLLDNLTYFRPPGQTKR